MSLDVYELIYAAFLYQVLLNIGMQESENFSTHSSTNFCTDLDGVCLSVQTCWSHEPYAHFILSNQYAREKTLQGGGGGGYKCTHTLMQAHTTLSCVLTFTDQLLFSFL